MWIIHKRVLIPAGISTLLLTIAVFPIKDYAYYILLRWIICFSATYLAYLFNRAGKASWPWLFALIALVFNPIIPLHLSKRIWIILDSISALIFGIVFLISIARRES